MRILIAGAGKVGKALTKELGDEGHDITLIDRKAGVLEDAQTKYDCITYQGNAATVSTLEEAEINDMDVFIAATSQDEVNLLSCLTAHSVNPNVHAIARIRDPQYIEQAYRLRESFGLSLVINPERQAAGEIARLLRYPGFLKHDVFEKARVEIVELKVDGKHHLADTKLSDIREKLKSQILITVVLRDGHAYMPDGNFVLKNGDRLFVTGAPEELHKMLRNTGVITHPVKHVVVAGGSRIAYYLAQELEKSRISTTIIEIDPDKCSELADTLPNTTILQGDVSNHSVLDSEDIGDYDAFVSATGLDELNILTSLYANMTGVPNIVTKLGRGEDNRLIDSLPIGSTVCPKDLITMHIVRYVRAIRDKKGAALTIHKLAEGQAEAIEFEVDDDTKHIGEPLKDIPIRKNILICSIGSGMRTVIPTGDTSFQLGDTVIVVADSERTIHTLNDIFEA